MNFAAMKQKLSDRGFAHLSDTRLGDFVNAARAEFDRTALWPWREASATGVAPLAISDLGPIEKVVNTSQSYYPLRKADYSMLSDSYGDLSTSGTPLYYYIATPGGSAEVATYPSNTDVIGVQYWRVTPDLVNPSDTPASPSECHMLIVDMAVRLAYQDNDEYFSASLIGSEIDRKIQQLYFQYPPGVADGPDAYVGVTFASEDW